MEYLRDGRSPVPTDECVSATMSRIRARNTKPELLVRRQLRASGFTGYRLHHSKVPGRPDIAFVGRRLAVFVHGCFWHGHECALFQPPDNNRAFWHEKIDSNRSRDARNIATLTAKDWRVAVVWECALRGRGETALAKVAGRLARWLRDSASDRIEVRR